MTAFVIVNPRAGNGRTRRVWPEIEDELEAIFPLMSVVTTGGPGQTARLVRDALREGHLDIITVGGDGTINEAINGFFERGAPVSPDAVFSFVTTGTAGDFRRTFGIEPGWEAGVAHLRQARIRKADIGRVSCLTPEGAPLVRYFINVASFGISGSVARRVNRARIAKFFGGSFAFGLHSAIALLGWRECRVRLMADGGYDEIAGISTVAVANGQYFGGGMKVAPHAVPSDGRFDLVIVGGNHKGKLLRELRAVHSGTHLDNPGVRMLRSTRLTAAPTLDTSGPVPVETDGESAGVLPATFEILHNAINLRV
ncbi:MAG TPA: diacylglycerol kinase family protein [Rhizomicrobium sp.]|jgi:YegS/Rv2252/BmrU family lipid kinase|nr:diacylglycerol kinase family protein [Rhizomicrobium sp.]